MIYKMNPGSALFFLCFQCFLIGNINTYMIKATRYICNPTCEIGECVNTDSYTVAFHKEEKRNISLFHKKFDEEELYDLDQVVCTKIVPISGCIKSKAMLFVYKTNETSNVDHVDSFMMSSPPGRIHYNITQYWRN